MRVSQVVTREINKGVMHWMDKLGLCSYVISMFNWVSCVDNIHLGTKRKWSTPQVQQFTSEERGNKKCIHLPELTSHSPSAQQCFVSGTIIPMSSSLSATISCHRPLSFTAFSSGSVSLAGLCTNTSVAEENR